MKIKMDTPIKFLKANARTPYANKRLELGVWLRVRGPLRMCAHGFHYTTPRWWWCWSFNTCHLVDLAGEQLVWRGENKRVTEKIRVYPKLTTWTPYTQRELAFDLMSRLAMGTYWEGVEVSQLIQAQHAASRAGMPFSKEFLGWYCRHVMRISHRPKWCSVARQVANRLKGEDQRDYARKQFLRTLNGEIHQPAKRGKL